MSDQVLSASGEAAWQALRQHIEWEQGFWVGWAFTDHTPSVHELHRRADALLRGVGRGTVLRQPREPSELVDVLLWLNAGADGCDGCVMVAVVNSGEAWRDAWDQLMLRLNERRELLRESLRGGLLLFAPTSFKASSREAAPDLWSIRSLVLDVAPVARKVAEETLQLSELEQETLVGSDTEVTLALQAVAAAQRAGQIEAEVDASTRAAIALFAVGRREEGRDQAVSAMERATAPGPRARTLVVLADIERQLGDLVAADSHYRAAIQLDGEAAGIWAYLHLADNLIRSHALTEARGVAEAGLARGRALGRQGETPEALRNEAASWERLGKVKQAQGDWGGAGEAFEASLALLRRRRSKYGGTVAALREEQLSLLPLGDTKLALGDLSAAGEAYDTSFALSRQLRGMLGDIADVLEGEALCLGRIGDLKMIQGDLSAASETYEAQLSVCRRRREMVGDTAGALRNEAMSLACVGDVKRALGELVVAGEMYNESLGLCRQERGMVGDTSEALSDEAMALERVGRVRQAQGDWEGAEGAYRESLGRFRQVRKIAGDTVVILECVAISLTFCAVVYRRDCRLDLARAALVEAADLWREVQVRCGRLPRNVRGLTEVLALLGRVLQDEIAGLRQPE